MSRLQSLQSFPAFFRASEIYRNTYGLLAGLRLALQVRHAHYVAARDALVPIVVPGAQGPVLLRAQTTDVDVFRQIFVNRELAIPCDHDARFIIDAGAHIGLSSIWLTHRFPRAHIVALEPDRSNFSLLEKNTAGYARITAINKALWWKKTSLAIEDPDGTSWSFRVSESSSDVTARSVDAITIQDLLEEFDRTTVDLLKMDVEGSELEVFSRDADQWIDRVGAMAVEPHDRFRPGCSEAIRGAVACRGFSETMSGEYLVFLGPRDQKDAAPLRG